MFFAVQYRIALTTVFATVDILFGIPALKVYVLSSLKIETFYFWLYKSISTMLSSNVRISQFKITLSRWILQLELLVFIKLWYMQYYWYFANETFNLRHFLLYVINDRERIVIGQPISKEHIRSKLIVKLQIACIRTH